MFTRSQRQVHKQGMKRSGASTLLPTPAARNHSTKIVFPSPRGAVFLDHTVSGYAHAHSRACAHAHVRRNRVSPHALPWLTSSDAVVTRAAVQAAVSQGRGCSSAYGMCCRAVHPPLSMDDGLWALPTLPLTSTSYCVVPLSCPCHILGRDPSNGPAFPPSISCREPEG